MIFFSQTISSANQEFEGIIVSVNSEAITTFDLSERIKLVIKSLNLEDTIENRDSVRERVLDLLILEKLKKNEVNEAQLEFSEEELNPLHNQTNLLLHHPFLLQVQNYKVH